MKTIWLPPFQGGLGGIENVLHRFDKCYNGISGIHLKLKVKGRGQFIVSQRWDKGKTTITLNGTQYGIEVSNLVFDNLSTAGLSKEEWIEDFDCPSGQFIIEEIEKF